MDAKAFLINALNDIVVQFPLTTVKYQHDDVFSNHIIEIQPDSLFSDQEYINREIWLTETFYSKYPHENLCFVISTDPVKITQVTWETTSKKDDIWFSYTDSCLENSKFEVQLHNVVSEATPDYAIAA